MIKAIVYSVFLLFILCSGQSGRAQSFEEVGLAVGISHLPDAQSSMGGGCAWFDYNGDGWEDLYVTGCQDPDKLYRNNGDGTFTDITETTGLQETALANTTGIVTGDIDNDGDRDLFVSTWRKTNSSAYAKNYLFENNGNGVFLDISDQAGITGAAFTMSAAFLDINNDGLLDIFCANYVSVASFIYEDGVVVGFNHSCFEDWLYINNGDNTFDELGVAYGVNNEGCALAVVGTDYNRDGDIDLLVANDFGQFIVPNKLYDNVVPGEMMADISEASGADIGFYGMGIAVGDYDEDLDLDYYITNLGRNVLLNQDAGFFTDITATAGVENEETNGLYHTGWGSFFFDYDNDTRLDLFVSNGHIGTVEFLDNFIHDGNVLYRNLGDGSFEDVSEVEGVADTRMSRGCAMADYDLDGDVDLVSCNIENNAVTNPDDRYTVYRNMGNGNNWVGFSLEGVTCNKDAFGAQVELYADGRVFLREHTCGGGGHCSQNSSLINFGLGDIDVIDSVLVYWPSGDSDFYVPGLNNYNHLVQGQSDIVDQIEQLHRGISIYPNPTSGILQIKTAANFPVLDLRILDGQGRLVWQVRPPSRYGFITQIDLPEQLNDGVYILRLDHGHQQSIHQFILQR